MKIMRNKPQITLCTLEFTIEISKQNTFVFFELTFLFYFKRSLSRSYWDSLPDLVLILGQPMRHRWPVQVLTAVGDSVC